MSKRLVLASVVLLLFGCQANEVEETEDTTTNDTDVGEVGEVIEDVDLDDPAPADEHPLSNLINETTFIEPYALQSWEDYQAVVQNVTYGEVTILNQENADLSTIEGTSSQEIDDSFSSVGLRDDVFKEDVEKSETETFSFYRYPAEEGSEYSEISDFLSELSFYYVEDNLMFSSITPGLYSLELNNLPEASTLMTFLTLDEIEAINPQVFTIAEMKINGNLIRQVMIPATHVNEQGTEENLAFYFFLHEEDIIQYAYIPFEMVMQSFPDYSVIVYQQLIPTIEEIDL